MMAYTYGVYVQRKNRSLLKKIRFLDPFHFECLFWNDVCLAANDVAVANDVHCVNDVGFA